MDLWISRYQMLLLHSFFILACTLLHILPEVTGFEKGKAIIAVVLMGAGHGIKLVTYPPYIAAQGGNEGTEALDKLFTYFYIYTTVATVIGIVGYSLFGEFFYLNFDIGRRYVVAYAVLAFFSMCSTCLLIFIRCCAFPYKRRKVLGLTANLLLLSICARKRKNASSEADAVNDEKYPKTNTFLDNAYPHKKRADILHVYQMFRMAKFLLIALPFYLVQSGMYTDWLELAYSKLHPCSLLICISPTTIIAVNPLLVLAFSLFHHYVTPKICEKTRSLWEKLTKLMCKRFHDDESFRQRKARNVKDGLKMMIGVAFLMLALVSKFTIKVTLDQLYPHPPSGITIFSSPSLAESVLKLKCETGALTIFERMAQKSPPAATVIYNWTLNRGGDLLLPRHLDIATYCTACDVWLEKSDEKIIANNKERIINNNETQQQYLFLRRIEPRRGVLLIWIDEEKKLHTSYLNVEASRHGPNSTRMVTKVIAAGCGLTQSTRLYFTDDSDIVQTSGSAIYVIFHV
ncbi:unnamed protein product, partial [Mesorhabditis belari]|uniref:Uncharacterized protein n=1 Tax=Mesorhabditis belari TaxID=2138241 RepID=A0AAF3EU89_9BILA